MKCNKCDKEFIEPINPAEFCHNPIDMTKVDFCVNCGECGKCAKLVYLGNPVRFFCDHIKNKYPDIYIEVAEIITVEQMHKLLAVSKISE